MPKTITIMVPEVGDYVSQWLPLPEYVRHADILTIYPNGYVYVEWWGTGDQETIAPQFLEWDDENETWRYQK